MKDKVQTEARNNLIKDIKKFQIEVEEYSKNRIVIHRLFKNFVRKIDNERYFFRLTNGAVIKLIKSINGTLRKEYICTQSQIDKFWIYVLGTIKNGTR